MSGIIKKGWDKYRVDTNLEMYLPKLSDNQRLILEAVFYAGATVGSVEVYKGTDVKVIQKEIIEHAKKLYGRFPW